MLLLLLLLLLLLCTAAKEPLLQVLFLLLPLLRLRISSNLTARISFAIFSNPTVIFTNIRQLIRHENIYVIIPVNELLQINQSSIQRYFKCNMLQNPSNGIGDCC